MKDSLMYSSISSTSVGRLIFAIVYSFSYPEAIIQECSEDTQGDISSLTLGQVPGNPG